MRRLILTIAAISCLASWIGSPSRSRWAAPAASRVAADPLSLRDLIPATALIAVEVRDVDRRWDEIRSIDFIAGFQDAILSCAGTDADLIHRLAGDRAVLFLAGSEDPPFVVPVAILRPTDVLDAERILAGLSQLSFRRAGGVLWVGPAGVADLLERMSRQETARLNEVLPMDEIDGRLPQDGLARGWLNPVAFMRLLHNSRVDSLPEPLRLAAATISAELTAVRYAAFRRDIAEGEILSEGIIAYDPARISPRVLHALDPEAVPALFPVEIPANAVAVVAFHPEAQACMPWLRNLAASDPHGPLRNLAFWLDEFQERFRRDLDRDLFSALGDHGWLLALDMEGSSAPGLAAVMEIREESVLASTLRDLMSWVGERFWISTFGTIIPRVWVDTGGGQVIYGTTLGVPFSEFPGPRFQISGRYLLLGDRPETLAAAREFAGSLPGNASVVWDEERNSAAHGSIWVKGPAIAKMLAAGIDADASDAGGCISKAAGAMAAGMESLRADWQYEPGAVRLHGRLRLAAQPVSR